MADSSKEHFTLFYGKSPFSNFFLSPFVEGGQTFSCVEQYMMFNKARMFCGLFFSSFISSSNTHAHTTNWNSGSFQLLKAHITIIFAYPLQWSHIPFCTMCGVWAFDLGTTTLLGLMAMPLARILSVDYLRLTGAALSRLYFERRVSYVHSGLNKFSEFGERSHSRFKTR